MGFALQLICASRASMANPPIARLTANGLLDAAVDFGADGEVNIKCDRELACKVFLELELRVTK
jgi:hypothetical protein